MVYRDVPTVLCTNEPEHDTDSVVRGIGIGQPGSFSAVPLIRTGCLPPLLIHNLIDDLGFYIRYARCAQMPLSSRTFIDFMVDALEKRLRNALLGVAGITFDGCLTTARARSMQAVAPRSLAPSCAHARHTVLRIPMEPEASRSRQRADPR